MAKKTSKHAAPARVESIRHRDTRKNIPTEELRDFVRDDEHTPKSVLYPRDPSLDPQLVWKGKDEQDQKELAVPVVPIYIQEKIHPQALIDDLPRVDKSGGQLDFFSDFNGLPPDFSDRINFYHHEGHWSNRMILGDSLLVMTSLAEKEGLKGKVQTIYLDPPYGIKFGSNWQVSTRKRDVKDGKAQDASRQPEQVRAFRDTWKLGIHSYLAYLRDRLTVARELLTETGSIFVQIGDENVHLVRSVMDEVFGSENFVSLITVAKTMGATSTLIPNTTDYIIWFCKDATRCKYRTLFITKELGDDGTQKYSHVESPDGTIRSLSEEEKRGLRRLAQNQKPFLYEDITSQTGGDSIRFPFTYQGQEFTPSKSRGWRTSEKGMRLLDAANRLLSHDRVLMFKRFLTDFPAGFLTNLWADTSSGSSTSDPKIYVVQTRTMIIQRCLLMTTDPGDLVLDPTCGSGTTAYVAEQWGRRWITCDTSRVALALARTRLMAGKFPYYLLADSAEGRKKEGEISGTALTPTLSQGERGQDADIRKGFVYKRVPHVTLKSIANNPDIKEGMTRKQIDAAISLHAETETLYDQPYEDKKTVRVTGPFTVESLSPHRTISVEEKKELSETGKDGWKVKVVGPSDFATMILDNLRKAGVQNTVKGERLKFDSLDPYAGEWIHAEGWYEEKGTGLSEKPSPQPSPGGRGGRRRVAVCIGPEHGTVGTQLIKEAAKEAVKGVGFDVLIVCGFAFDPSVNEEAKRYGKLTVLAARMNPDLAMGDELLKKTGAGNLFMVFGEPDVEITKRKDGKVTVEVKGVDVYDPTTGAIRSSSTDDIACWFIDTAYNGESFFVRHAYFTGAEEPYEKLKRALRADIDEAAWAELYSTKSRPFPQPATGKIAVKVINHYGDEVLKVYGV